MFTGIVQGCVEVHEVVEKKGLIIFTLEFPKPLLKGLKKGASVSVDGVCLTVVKIDGNKVTFDVMGETLKRTTIGQIKKGSRVNIERSIKAYDEIGGHIVSGHVDSTAEIIKVEKPENNHIVTFECSKDWMKYVFSKGFIALDGVSLTIVDVNRESNTFTVWFIQETLRLTTFGFKNQGDVVNLEVERNTKIMVDTIVNTLEGYFDKRKEGVSYGL